MVNAVSKANSPSLDYYIIVHNGARPAARLHCNTRLASLRGKQRLLRQNYAQEETQAIWYGDN